MESKLEIKKNKERYEVIVSYGRKGKRGQNTVYHNILDRDPKKIAQVLIDLEIVDSFPMFEAVKIYLQRRENKDWLGL